MASIRKDANGLCRSRTVLHKMRCSLSYKSRPIELNLDYFFSITVSDK